MKLTKYLCHALTIKDVLDDGIYTLACFYKDSVTSCKKIQKDCDKKRIEKEFDKKNIKKDCDKKDCKKAPR